MLDNSCDRAPQECGARVLRQNRKCLKLHRIRPVFTAFMQRQRLFDVLYVDKQQCNFLAYKKCIRIFQMYFTASETAIRFRLVSLGWMRFNIQFEETGDRGFSTAACLTPIESRYSIFKDLKLSVMFSVLWNAIGVIIVSRKETIRREKPPMF